MTALIGADNAPASAPNTTPSPAAATSPPDAARPCNPSVAGPAATPSGAKARPAPISPGVAPKNSAPPAAIRPAVVDSIALRIRSYRDPSEARDGSATFAAASRDAGFSSTPPGPNNLAAYPIAGAFIPDTNRPARYCACSPLVAGSPSNFATAASTSERVRFPNNLSNAATDVRRVNSGSPAVGPTTYGSRL